MSLLSRAFGVHPYRTHTVRVQRDLVIPAGDGVPLLANRSYPADIHKPPLVLLPARTAAAWRWTGCRICWPNVATRCCTSLRGTGGSSGVFDGFTINPADGDGVLSWLREQPWFGGVLATWGASYLGFAQGSPPAISRNGRSRSSSTRRQSLHISSCIQVADSRWVMRWVGCR